MLTAHSRMSVVEAEAYLRVQGRLRSVHPFPDIPQDYARDHHFVKYIFTDLKTVEDVEQFLRQLDQDNADHTEPGPFRWGCSKARVVRESIQASLDLKLKWYDHFNSVYLSALGRARRVHCSCHEVGSFARLDALPSTHPERFVRMLKSVPQAAKASPTTSIAPDVLAAIKAGSWQDGGFVMPPLDRVLYQKVAKVLTSLGGKWNRKAGATLFDDPDAEVSLRLAAETGTYVDAKKAYQFFETPPEVAKILIEHLHLHGQHVVLEPSAGNGALICAVAEACTGDIHCDLTAVELDPARETRLKEMVGSVSQVTQKLLMGDFLGYDKADLGSFDRIIMNPPFANSQDIHHVRHAFSFLQDGGRLVAIMSPGWTFRSDKVATQFREWLKPKLEASHAYQFDLPPGSFKSSGTNVRTIVLVVEKWPHP